MNSSRRPGSGHLARLSVALAAIMALTGSFAPAVATADTGSTNTIKVLNSVTNGATTTIDPPATGGSFSVNLVANGSQLISGAGSGLQFDNAKLQVTALAKDATEVANGVSYFGFPSSGAMAAFIATANTNGQIPNISWAYLDGSSAETANADHGIYKVTFSVIGLGDSTLTPNALPKILDGTVLGYGNQLTPVAASNGSVVNTAAVVATQVRVETAANGSGTVIGAQDLASGATLTAYAVSRDAGGAFIANVPVTWSLQSKTGGVADGDLVASVDTRSAVLTGHLVGSAIIRATGAFTGNSATITVVPGAATQVRVETAANGSGTVVGPQDLASGATLTAYAISRDAGGNFVANVPATWSLQSKTGGVVDGDLVASGDTKSAILTGHLAGTAIIRATGAFTGDSGAITVRSTPPTPPTGSITTLAPWLATNTVAVRWAGTAGTNPIATYDVRYRKAAYNGTFGGYTTWLSATALTTSNFATTPGFTYCFSGLARDTTSVVSAWTAETCTAAPLDDRSLARAGSWSLKTGSAYYRSTYVTSKSNGAKLTRTGVKVKRIALVATTCPTCGTVKVYLGSRLLKTVSLRSTATVNKKLITITTFSTVTSGTLYIKVSGSKKVMIDGVILSAR